MEKEKLNRINELAKKKKEGTLTEEEAIERLRSLNIGKKEIFLYSSNIFQRYAKE